MPPLKMDDCCGGVCDFRYARDTRNPRHQGGLGGAAPIPAVPITRITPREAYLSRRLVERVGRAIRSDQPVGHLDEDVRVPAAPAALKSRPHPSQLLAMTLSLTFSLIRPLRRWRGAVREPGRSPADLHLVRQAFVASRRTVSASGTGLASLTSMFLR
jgi:hypothetical protein